MKLLFVSDSFKGSLSSEQTIELLTKAAEEIFPNCSCGGMPVADGGEGTAQAVVQAVNGRIQEADVQGPLGEQAHAFYGQLDEKRAVLEMACASGLPLVPEKERNPEKTTTFGTGELIRHVLDDGYRDISIAIGGSATNDGGMGCMRALGVKFLDKSGKELQGCGEDLIHVAEIDVSGLDPRILQSKITVMCDVTNPLCGKDGATWTFGKQKGADESMQERLEAGMQNYRDVIKRQFGIDLDQIPGAGAAGGLGAALLVFLHGELKSGIETVLELIDFDRKLEDVSLVVTGEGRTDWQSCFGKVVQGVGDHCKKKGVPVAALVGSMGPGAEKIYDHGICSIMTTVNGVMPLEEAMDHAEELYYAAALRLFRFIKTGMDIEKNLENRNCEVF